MDRRAFISTFTGGLLATPLAAEGQPAGKVWRIGYLGYSSPALEQHLIGAFRQGLRDLGYVEGQNVAIRLGRKFQPTRRKRNRRYLAQCRACGKADGNPS